MELIKYKIEKGYNLTENKDLNFRIVDVVDNNLHDIVSDIPTWYRLAYINYYDDYTKMREFAKTKFVPNWANLTLEDKTLLMNHWVYPIGTSQQDIDALLSTEDQLYTWINVAKQTKVDREIRWEYARRKVSLYLTQSQSLDMYNSTRDMSMDYKDANIPSLLFWIQNGAYAPLGIDYTLNGFAQKAYYTEDIKTLLVDCLVNGKF